MPWSSVLWWLHDDERVISLVEDTVPGAAQALTETTAGTEDAVLDRWRWLNRTWDPDAPVRRRNRPSSAGGTLRQSGHELFGTRVAVAGPRWDGMSRGIAGGLPDPALEVCTHWAAGAVASVLSAECRGFVVSQRVHVMAGDFTGRRGYVQDLGWIVDDEEQKLTGPAGYIVDLDGTEGTTPIDAEDLEAARDDRWARRPAGTLKDGPPQAGALRCPRAPHAARTWRNSWAGPATPTPYRRNCGRASETRTATTTSTCGASPAHAHTALPPNSSSTGTS